MPIHKKNYSFHGFIQIPRNCRKLKIVLEVKDFLELEIFKGSGKIFKINLCIEMSTSYAKSDLL